MSYQDDIETYRNEKDQYMKNNHRSPIPEHERGTFTSLNYFPIKKSYRLELPLQTYDEVDQIEMQTNTGDARMYDRIGYIEFEVEGNEAKLNVYQSVDNPNYYFVPFRDSTSGKTTYGSGRYLELEKDNGTFVVDFNKAYNPFCAYSENYVCPLPPMENWLDIPIRAGEKDYKNN